MADGTARITHIDCWHVAVRTLHEWVASPAFGEHSGNGPRVILRLRDSDGYEGWGESATPPSQENISAAMQMLLGQPTANLRTSFPQLWAKDALYWQRPTPPSPYASPIENMRFRLRHPLQTAVETALCDIITRRAGVPMHHMFGGAWRDRVSVDYWMGRTEPEHAQRCVQRGKELGFRGIKLKTTLEDPNVERLEAIRDAAGLDWKVTVDPNGRFYRLDDAWQTIRDMDRVGNMAILEDPFPRPALNESAALRKRIDARLVIHIDPPEMLSQVLRSDAAGGLNIDSHTQGLFHWRVQAGVADQFNLPVWHGSGLDLGIYTAAQLHLAAATPNCQLSGDQVGPWLRESHLMTENFKVEQGFVLVPTGPGLGIEIDMAELDRYTTNHQTWSS